MLLWFKSMMIISYDVDDVDDDVGVFDSQDHN